MDRRNTRGCAKRQPNTAVKTLQSMAIELDSSRTPTLVFLVLPLTWTNSSRRFHFAYMRLSSVNIFPVQNNISRLFGPSVKQHNYVMCIYLIYFTQTSLCRNVEMTKDDMYLNFSVVSIFFAPIGKICIFVV